MAIRDSQRSKVYAWGPGGGYPLYTWKEVVDLCERVFQAYGLSTPEIKDGRGTRIARGGASGLNLPLDGYAIGPADGHKRGRNVVTILHECAHAVTFKTLGTGVEGHGPEFVRIHIDLLERFAGMNGPELRRDARVHKVKIAPAGAVPHPYTPRAIKRLEAIKEEIRQLDERRSALVQERREIRVAAGRKVWGNVGK